MSIVKKYGVPILVGLIIGGIVSIGYIWWLKSQTGNSSISEARNTTPSPTPTSVKLLTWTDPNGFSFQYPEGLSVNRHDEDKENYAHIEFTHPDHPGKLIVWGKDPARGVTDTGSWVKNEKRFIGASTLDTELGGQAAKKVMVTGITRMLVVGSVYDNIVWSVEATLEDADFWTGVHTAISDSFAFVPVKEPGSAAVSESGPVVEDVAVDEEEVIE
ncbi:hypothetical protein HY411_03325 [Candidatus Gottesmanbacteria bacterium]|nr:hypothetical protein [Candidatus Gottesmanbacteria bacterium]